MQISKTWAGLMTAWALLLLLGAARETHGKRVPKKAIPHSAEKDTAYWYENAQTYLSEKLLQHSDLNQNLAKNIILFLGDGMSVQTLTATRAYLGDVSRQLSFEKFPYVGLSKTYCYDKQVPDSASTSTAYLSGIKANYRTIGVSAQVPYGDCEHGQREEYHTQSLAKWAQDAGKWAGLVTTARVTHASPAGVYAHTANRAWETDTAITEDGCDATRTVDIARQLIEWPVGLELRVILGGGRRSFLNETVRDHTNKSGRRSDGRNLIKEWLSGKRQQNVNAEYVRSKQELYDVSLKKTDYLLGLFSASHCPYHGELESEELAEDIPSLSEMTERAIKLLSRSEKGFFLFVEGAKIDMAHHANRARRSLEETEEFARAVELAQSMTSREDTLIVVTSDHSHSMTFSGYPKRDSDILGLNDDKADDGLPYTILSYANGPGYDKTYSKKKHKDRKNLSNKDFENPKRKYMATVPLQSATHGADDVGIFALGPHAQLFSGNYQQTNIPMLLAKAARIGPFTAE